MAAPEISQTRLYEWLTGVLMLVVGGLIGLLAQRLGGAGLLAALALMGLGAAASAQRLPEVE